MVSTHHELLEQLSKLEQFRSHTPVREQRKVPRAEVRWQAMLVAVDQRYPNEISTEVQLRDLSWFGVGLVSQVPLAINSRWRQLFILDNQQMDQQLVCVRHCTDLDNGVYLAGAQFCVEPSILGLLGAQAQALQPS